MRGPNFLKFVNNVLLSDDKRGAYNVNTGDMNPDTGYFVELDSERLGHLDRDNVLDFWRRHYSQLCNPHLWLGVWQDDDGSWYYAVGELIDNLESAMSKAWARGQEIVFDNQNREPVMVGPIGI